MFVLFYKYRLTNPPFQWVTKEAAICTMSGRRPIMEDRYAVSNTKLNSNLKLSYYGIFDGHGGDLASQYLSKNLHEEILTNEYISTSPEFALRETFLTTNNNLLTIAESKQWDDGSTACIALVIGQVLYVANAGDSRAILVSKMGRSSPLSYDHKASLKSERERIRSLGGSIVQFGEIFRVEGVLSVSRAFGDRSFAQFIYPEPGITKKKITSNDHYLVLVTDGVTDVMSNYELGRIAFTSTDAGDLALKIVNRADENGSMDNMSALVVDLSNFLKYPVKIS